MRSRNVPIAALVVVLAGLTSAAPAIHGSAWWEPDAHESLAALGDLEQAEAVALSRPGGYAAAAFPSPDHPRRSILKMSEPGARAADAVQVPGRVRALRFPVGGGSLYAIVYKEGKRGPSETFLMVVDIDSLRAERRVNLPLTAHDLEIWGRADSLAVVAEDEIRTFLLPEFRSGPLFRIPGRNLAALNEPGTDRFVIGRTDELIVVDLGDPPGPEAMPVRERLPLDAPVTALRYRSDGKSVSVKPEIGEPYRVWLNPLRTTPELPDGYTPPSSPKPAAVAAAAATAPALIESREPAPEVPSSEGETSTATPPTPSSESAPAPVDTPVETEVPADPPPVEPEPAAAAPSGAILYGRITGDGREDVRSVIAYGPDNLLREAARVDPEPDGRWSFAKLDPGTYRIVLGAGGDKVVQSSPAFLVIKVEGDDPVEAPAIEVFRVR